MRAQIDEGGRFQGLWSLSLQEPGEPKGRPQQAPQASLRQQALQAFWSRRNLAEDLAQPPRDLQPRWIVLRQLCITVNGERELPELLGELLQRCDDCISSRVADSPAQEQPHAGPEFCDGPLGRPVRAEERQWLECNHPVLHPADLARQLGELPGLQSVEALVLAPHLQDPTPAEDAQRPHGAMQRCGRDWALRLRWPEQPSDLDGWSVLKDGAAMRLERGPLLTLLKEYRQVMYLRRANSGGAAVSRAQQPAWTGLAGSAELSPLPTLRADHLPATAALPALYEQALQSATDREPGLRAQWTGYRALLEQGLLQVQVQREQMPRLYALDQTDPRSYWPGLPGESQLPGVGALLRKAPDQLSPGAWIDDDPLARRHRLLDYQLALHGELLDHGALQGLPCYFSPSAWAAHLLQLKRDFARRLPRLTQERHAGADYSLALLDAPDNTPPLQERLSLQLALMKSHSRRLSSALAALEALAAGPRAQLAVQAQQLSSAQPVLFTQSRAKPLEGATLAQRLQQLGPLLRRISAGTDFLLAAASPQRFLQLGDAGPLLLLDESGQSAWQLAAAPGREQARSLALALHELACLVQLHSEGLHLVEPLLLRPTADGALPLRLAEADAVQLYVVCTGWTARARDERFRELAQTLLQREAPAHLRCELLWLTAEAMRDFESHWLRWLTLRRAYCQALLAEATPPDFSRELDLAAEQLQQFLAAQQQAQAQEPDRT